MGTTETLHWTELEMREAGHCLGRYERCFGVSGGNISTGPIFEVCVYVKSERERNGTVDAKGL